MPLLMTLITATLQLHGIRPAGIEMILWEQNESAIRLDPIRPLMMEGFDVSRQVSLMLK